MLGIGCGVWSAWIPSSVRMEVVVGVEPDGDASAPAAPCKIKRDRYVCMRSYGRP